MKHLDLFSGIGGFSLACEWAEIETIGFVENDAYCQKVLRKHWPQIPIVEDIRDVEEDSFPRPVDLITAGFPCQPFSVAGKRGSTKDDRYLWPETLAVIKAVKPKWVLLENVAGIIPLALDDVLSDLEGAGYAWESCVIPAVSVGAWHRRDRVWVVAHAESDGLCTESPKGQRGNLPELARIEIGSCSEDVADTEKQHSYECHYNRGSRPRQIPEPRDCSEEEGPVSSWWATEPELGRVAYGIPNRVDRLKCLGNAIVPQVAYEIIRVIKEIEG